MLKNFRSRKVAKAVNISANHLSEKFKQVTGINFVDYVARARFEKACELLRDVESSHQRDRIRSRIPIAVAVQSCFQEVVREISERISGNLFKANETSLNRGFWREIGDRFAEKMRSQSS